MNVDIYWIAVGILLAFAILDLIVGVANDAANFLTASLGSRVAPLFVILAVASLGILVGVTFSNGMMEVARKGIFNPQFFTMPDLMMIFLAVMFADVIVLDVFNTYGLPTSTTVSIVFDLLGAAVAVAAMKLIESEGGIGNIGYYINSAKVLTIIFGILLSVGIAFVFGAVVQFFSRLLFTFEYEKQLPRCGALWGGAALAFITHFILISGAKGTSFLSPESIAWLEHHSLLVLLIVFAVGAVLLQVLLLLRVNVLKPIILVGTFALALAFAANDLVNFIGVPLAGLYAFRSAIMTDSPLTVPMTALSSPVHTNTALLLTAGIIMVLTIWLSKKARTVSEMELNLGRQEEGFERFESVAAARVIVRIVSNVFESVRRMIPARIQLFVRHRMDASRFTESDDESHQRSFDLLRASVNLMVASALVSFATSLKLPLSTTYVTFMVSMGSSLADQAWGRETAVYRVTGVLTVIAGWFVTALLAFCMAFAFGAIIFYGKVPAVCALLALVIIVIWRTHNTHKERVKVKEEKAIFNLKKVTDAEQAIAVTFQHTAIFLREIRQGLSECLDALFEQDLDQLRKNKNSVKKIQDWSNIITANIFKSLRQLEKDDVANWYKYAQTIRCLQSITEGYRDVVLRAYLHINDNHHGLLPVQIKELQEIRGHLEEILVEVEKILTERCPFDFELMVQRHKKLREAVDRFNVNQVERIRNRSSKTRLSILFYSIIGNSRRISRQNLRLLEIFKESFHESGAPQQIMEMEEDF